jgi:hypothetical protein
MKSQRFIQTVKVVVLATVLVVGVQFVAAQTAPSWSPPLTQPPSNNTYAPLNVSLTGQVKDGGLTLGFTLPTTGNALLVPTGRIGVGTGAPAQKIDVVGGSVKADGFCLPGASPTGGCITAWSSGSSGITCGAGGCTLGKIPKFSGPNTVINSVITDNGANVGIGITDATPDDKLEVNGGAIIGNTRLTSTGGVNYIQSAGLINNGTTRSGWAPLRFTGYSETSAKLIIDLAGNVGIGMNDPTTKLDVNGSVRIRGGSPNDGDVLTATDSNGNATWEEPQVIRWDKWVELTYMAGTAFLKCNTGWIATGFKETPPQTANDNSAIRCTRVDSAVAFSNPAVTCPNPGNPTTCLINTSSDPYDN